MSDKTALFARGDLDTVWTLTKDVYPQFKEPDCKTTVQLWREALAGLSLDEAKEALKEYAKTNTFPPKPCDFNEVAREKKRYADEKRRRMEEIEKTVCEAADFAVDAYPIRDEIVRERAKALFIEKCNSTENPVRAAALLEDYLRSKRNDTNGISVDKIIEGVQIVRD